MFYLDYWYIILVIPAILLGIIAQAKISSAYKKYSAINCRRGYTAADAARRILDKNGLYSVGIERVAGNLTDHYDPKTNVVRLSESVYSSSSVAALGIAAHEAGHAVQHAAGYAPMKLRSAIIPVTNLGSRIAPLIILLGFMVYEPLIPAGIILFSTVALFQLVTLPVEFNASRRALATLEDDAILDGDELAGAKKVLSAAAMTYVAALLISLASILRLVLLYGGRRNRQ